MNKRQRKKQLQRQELIQLQQNQNLSKREAKKVQKSRQWLSSVSSSYIRSDFMIGTDTINQFVSRKRKKLKRNVKRFHSLVDDYVAEQVEIRKQIIQEEREKFLEIEMPPYIDYEAEMYRIGFPLRKGELKVIPDLDFMENHYFRAWDSAYYNVLEEAGYRGDGLRKLLDKMSYNMRDLAVQTFVERQFEDPWRIVADARRLIEREIIEYAERYAEEKAKVYAFENKPNATGKRSK